MLSSLKFPIGWLTLLFLALLCSPTNHLHAAKPNVILIMTDDQGYGDLSCHGNPTLKTPHLDRLHSESVRFTDFHVSPFCTPTRAALMTGRYPARTGAYRTSSGLTSLHAREKTLGDLFTRNGYSTGMFGKWHLGDCAPSRPMDKGFETSTWHRCGGLTQISDYWGNDYFDDTYLVGDQWKKFEGYCTDVWFDESMKFISDSVTDAGGSKPFFVYLATNAPHGPYIVADKWKRRFLEAGIKEPQASFRGMVENFDWNMGRLLKFLDDEKLRQDTVVIYLTDNGTSAGARFGEGSRIYGWPINPAENANMRGGKSSAYDGGHRVPLFVRWPAGKLGQPRDIQTLTAHLDITPTLIDLCGLSRPDSWPPLDGRSLTPLITDPNPAWKERTLHTQMHGGNGYRKPGDLWEIGAAMTTRWRLVEGKELYDIKADPEQRKNLAKQHPEIVKQLTADHQTWFDSVKSGMQPTRILVGSEFENPTDLTSQEWTVSPGNPPWARSHVTRRMIANGPWRINVAREGQYRISLSRWPSSTDQPIDSTQASIKIAGQKKTLVINDPKRDTTADFLLDLPAGPTELWTELTTPDGKKHGAYFASVERIDSAEPSQPSVLWTQYGLADHTLKLAAHTDADPLNPIAAMAELQLKEKNGWQTIAETQIDPLTAMATFRVENWDSTQPKAYRVICGRSQWTGIIRAEPTDRAVLKLAAIACVNDKYAPYAEAIEQIVKQDPDLIFFAGDQIYESNAGGQIVEANTTQEVPKAMANYLAKWRRFGMIFRQVLRDRPSIMITDDHDIYANDLWGDGGRRMNGSRTTGGYPMHPDWVNAAEKTQTWNLPDAHSPGPWGDGINAYFTALEYGGVSFAILEDRKFKSPPATVVKQAIPDPRTDKPNRTPEVIMDPAFDASKLDRPDLQLLGKTQEDFLSAWALDVKRNRQLAAVLSQSPFVNIGNYDVNYGDMDSNGWPQSARNRALKAIVPSGAVMISGDIHFGTLHQHGINDWGDGPWSYSLPAFASNPNRKWQPNVPAQGREFPGVTGSGNHHDRFGNKLTVRGLANGYNGYGIILFDKTNRQVTLQLHTMNADRKPSNDKVPGWPLQIEVR